MNFVPTLPERTRDFEARRSRTHNENAGIRLLRRNALRMPALAPFLAHRWILRAADRRNGHVARHADVAADALANVVDAAFLDLLWQKRIGDRRSRGANHVQYAAPDLIDHRIR